jgi:hypothetical protein
MHVVINHLHLREPLTDATAHAMQDGLEMVVDAGGHDARVVRVDDRHLILILEFADAGDADRVAREVGGPWMRDHIVPLLDGPTDRNVGEVIAAASR